MADNLVAGHPSAVKAGGMRIVQNKQISSDRPAKDAEDCTGLTQPVVAVNMFPVCGTQYKGYPDHSTEAVQMAHSPKPPYSFPSKPMIHIQQPRK